MIPLRIACVFLCIFCIALNVYQIYSEIKFPAPDKLKRSNGIIHHPTYGDYPEKVKFVNGMSILPGQVAEMGFLIPEELRGYFKKGEQN